MDTPSKAAPETGHKHPPSTRAERGLALFRDGAVSEHGDLYTVRGTSRNYTVSLVDGEPRCDCPDFKARHATCKHGFAVVVHEAKRRCRRAARPTTEQPSRRHGTPRDDRRDARRGSAPAGSGGIGPARVRANVARMAD